MNEIYIIKDITEAVYGCEECAAGARALVALEAEDGVVVEEEMTETWLAFIGADIGTRLVRGADNMLRPLVKVAAAVICAEKADKKTVFATRRGCGEHKGKWEFPGGKAEKGETPAQTLVREIKEELDTDIAVGEKFYTVEYDYPRFHLSMDCFFAQLTGSEPVLKEHDAAAWLSKNDIATVDWLPADLELVEKLKKLL